MSDYFNGVYRGVMDGSTAKYDLASKQALGDMINAPIKMTGDMIGFKRGQKMANDAAAKKQANAVALLGAKTGGDIANYGARKEMDIEADKKRKELGLGPAQSDLASILFGGGQ